MIRAASLSLRLIAAWAASLGYKGIQIPSNDRRLFDLELAASSRGYCDDVSGQLDTLGIVVTELSSHTQGQLVAVHPAYQELCKGFAPPPIRDQPGRWQEWATRQLLLSAKASFNL